VTLSRKEERKSAREQRQQDYAEKIAEQQKTIDNTFGTFFRNSCWVVFLFRNGGDVRTYMVGTIGNQQITASDDFIKRLDSPPEPLSPTWLASCVTQRTAALFYVQ